MLFCTWGLIAPKTWLQGTYFYKLLHLKTAALDSDENCKVILSQPMTRVDDGKAGFTISKLNDLLEEMDIPIVKNRNITVNHLGSKGLQLNPHGTARFAINLKASIRKLWTRYGNSVHTGYQNFNAKNYLSANSNYTEVNDDTSDLDILKDLRCKILNRILIGHLIINSLRNKFEILVSSIAVNLDILMISETKLDKSFPATQFLIAGFENPVRLDRSSSGGGIMLYIREWIPRKLLKSSDLSANSEACYVEVKINKKKWLLCCSCSSEKA